MNDDHVAGFVAVCACAATTAIVAESDENARQRQRPPQPLFHRAALQRPMRSYHSTTWRQLLSIGSSINFLIPFNVDRYIFFDLLSPLFKEERVNYSFGSPYRNEPKTTGCPCMVNSEALLI